jgi:hypothetical protein
MFRAATEIFKTLKSFKGVVAALVCAGALEAPALTFSNSYRSPRNPERRIRVATSLIILHTTEAHARSSLNKLRERGEAHYCVPEDGTVYRIVDRDRVAFHAGRSMWNGKEDCDEFAIGIEVVGYHNKPITLKQIAALKELIALLKKMYNLNDGQVVCHSHVAYGAPNKWQSRRHRGRKRCGMLFAMWSVRTRLGLKARPAYDPDVKAGRLMQADPQLARSLYGTADTMAAHYAKAGKVSAAEKKSGGLLAGLGELFGLGADKEKPKPKASPKKVKPPPAKPAQKKTSAPAPAPKPAPGHPLLTPEDWRAAAKFVSAKDSDETRPVLRAAPTDHPVMRAAPPKPGEPSNWYLLPNGTYFQDDRLPKDVKLKPGTKKLIGYVKGGPLGAGQSAYSVAGKAWNAPTTWYVMGGKIFPGNTLDARSISRGAIIFYKK